jgi:hypothetical protein
VKGRENMQNYNVKFKEFRNEYKLIIDRLISVQGDIRKKYMGIGQDKCADHLEGVINDFNKELKAFDNIKYKIESPD